MATTSQFTTTTPAFVKTVTYDRGDYRAELNGEIKGFYRSETAALSALNDLVYDLLDEQVLDAAQCADDEADYIEAIADVVGCTPEQVADVLAFEATQPAIDNEMAVWLHNDTNDWSVRVLAPTTDDAADADAATITYEIDLNCTTGFYEATTPDGVVIGRGQCYSDADRDALLSITAIRAELGYPKVEAA